MVYKRLLSKLSLKNKFNHRIFLIGLALKLLLISLVASSYTLFSIEPFIEYYLASNFENPYSHFSQSEAVYFPYPFFMLLIISASKLIFNLLAVDFLASFSLKLPMLVADIAIFYILKSWLNHQHLQKLLFLYWFSPVLAYISYVHGLMDAIPISLLLMSLFCLFRNKLIASSLLLALSMAAKTMIIAILPFIFIFLISQRISMYRVLIFFAILLTSFVLINYQYIFDPSFQEIVFQNKEQLLIFSTTIQIDGLVFYVLPFAYGALLIRCISLKAFNKDLFIMFLAFCFGILITFIKPAPGWYFWLLPLFFYFFAKSDSRAYFMVIALQVSYLAYFLTQNEQQFFYLPGSIGQVIVDMHDFPSNYLPATNIELLNNSLFTLLQGFLLLNCIALYIFGLIEYSRHKITAVPFLIGVGGDSGSGKSTLSNALAKIFGDNNLTQLHGDDLHRWERGNVNWSTHTHLDPKANVLHNEILSLKTLLKRKSIFRKNYLHESGNFSKEVTIKPSNLIIYEGLHPFFLNKQRELFDLKLFLNPSKEINDHWKIERDIKFRGKSKDEVTKQINDRLQDSQNFIQAQIKYADMIIEPDYREDSKIKTLGFNVTLPNSYNLDPFLTFFNTIEGVQTNHSFPNDNDQALYFSGVISSGLLNEASESIIPGLRNLGIMEPSWPEDSFGMLLFLIINLIFQEVEHERY